MTSSAEEVIDALLSDNLQPRLLLIDRSMQRMWIGKGGGAAGAGTVSLDASKRDAAVVYKAVEDADFKQLQRERIRKMEQQREFDHMLLAREYNDDYDDQVRVVCRALLIEMLVIDVAKVIIVGSSFSLPSTMNTMRWICCAPAFSSNSRVTTTISSTSFSRQKPLRRLRHRSLSCSSNLSSSPWLRSSTGEIAGRKRRRPSVQAYRWQQ